MIRRTAALLALLLVAACTGGGDGTSAEPSGDVVGDIVIASGLDVTGKGGIRQQLIDAWNDRQDKEGTGFTARLVELTGSADEQRSQLLGALQSGSARYDVVNLDVTWVPEFAESGLVRELPDDLLDDDVIESVADTARWDGKVYAAPFNSDVGLLYYRRDHLKAAGLTQTELTGDLTWKGLLSAMDSLGDDEPGGYEKGWTTQLGAYEGRTVNAVEAFASAVADLELTDDRGQYSGDADTLEKGIRELRERTRTPYVLRDAFDSNEATSMADFATGRTTFLRHWPYAYGTLHQTFGEEQLGVVPLPGKAVLGGQNLAVTKASQRAGKAKELIEFLTGEESERCLLDAGFAATRESAYTDDRVRCTAAATPVPSATGERPDDMPREEGRPAYARSTLLPALQHAVQRPRTALYGAFTQTLIAQLGPLFTDDPPPEEELAKSLHTALKKALPR
ncbi:extracellular solute-binding protein [Streptomyces sp. GESEQ-35]|uniref:extracellular solute-binding protein n=1 Tax=Streptomyces sp. GESEQ-35 TaxID=2812657 RepID=UPI001B32776A|nr:extracellular solute-binding protein [Streptomyces sp. GESEQ-35]